MPATRKRNRTRQTSYTRKRTHAIHRYVRSQYIYAHAHGFISISFQRTTHANRHIIKYTYAYLPIRDSRSDRRSITPGQNPPTRRSINVSGRKGRTAYGTAPLLKCQHGWCVLVWSNGLRRIARPRLAKKNQS